MGTPPNLAAGGGGDEVARQRGKRRAAISGRSVPGWPTMTLGDLAEEARAVSSPEGSADAVRRFLSEAGHRRDTIAAVLVYLGLDRLEPDHAAGVVEFPGPSSRRERRRTLAQIQAMLLDD